MSSCHELSNYRISITRNIADGHGFLSSFFSCPELSRLVLGPTDQREVIIEFQSHGVSRTVTDFSFLSRIFEFSNFISLSRDLSFVPNYRIIEFQSHGISRTVTDFHFFLFLSRIIEFSNFIFLVPRLVFCPELSNFRILSFCPETCPLSRIIELSNFCLP